MSDLFILADYNSPNNSQHTQYFLYILYKLEFPFVQSGQAGII